MSFVCCMKTRKNMLEQEYSLFKSISHYSPFSSHCVMQRAWLASPDLHRQSQSKNPLAHITDDQPAKNDSEVMDYMDRFTKPLTEIRGKFIRNIYLLVLKIQMGIFVF